MKISYAENISFTKNLMQIELCQALKDIQNGKYKNPIEHLREIKGIDLEDTKSKQNEYKKNNLPYIVPATFKTGLRKRIDLDSSELMLFDFDSVPNLFEVREQFMKDETVYSLFISPRGNGLKVIYRLDKPITDHELFSRLYSHFGEDLNNKYGIEYDKSCIDVCRACFVSYDTELYLNENAIPLNTEVSINNKIFSTNGHAKVSCNGDSVSDADSLYNGIVSYLEKFKGYEYKAGFRHRYLVAVSGGCNAYGVEKEYLKRKLISDYQNKAGFVEDSDFEKIVEDVYSTYTSQHNTKTFIKEDEPKTFSGLSIIHEFWYREKEKLSISRENLLKFLELNGFGKMYYGKSYIFIQIIDNIIYEVDTVKIKDFVVEYSKIINVQGLNELLLRGVHSYFAEALLSSIVTIKPNIKRDTSKEAYFYFNNCFVKVTLDKIQALPYSKLDGMIWDNQKMKRDFVFSNVESDFEKFIKNIGRGDIDRINSLKSAIGFLLHSYKDSSNAKAIIFCDERIGDGSNGRCGKSLVGQAIGKLKNTVFEDGRTFSFKSNFAFQKVNLDTQIYFYNDVSKMFDFNKLFSMITDSMTIEKKNKDAFSIPFSESPKILISTNFVICGDDDSTADRKFELEFSDFYNINHKPMDDFNKQFFDGWNDAEWNGFDSFMLGCVQLFLSDGLIKPKYINLDLKKIQTKTCKEFIEFMEDVPVNTEHNKKEVYDNFKELYLDHRDLKQNTFTIWLKEYAKFKKLRYDSRKTGNILLFTLSTY